MLRADVVRHLRVLAIAGAFGLAAYAVVRVLIHVTRALGWLSWLQG